MLTALPDWTEGLKQHLFPFLSIVFAFHRHRECWVTLSFFEKLRNSRWIQGETIGFEYSLCFNRTSIRMGTYMEREKWHSPTIKTFVPVQEAVDACWSADAAKQKGHARWLGRGLLPLPLLSNIDCWWSCSSRVHWLRSSALWIVRPPQNMFSCTLSIRSVVPAKILSALVVTQQLLQFHWLTLPELTYSSSRYSSRITYQVPHSIKCLRDIRDRYARDGHVRHTFGSCVSMRIYVWKCVETLVVIAYS